MERCENCEQQIGKLETGYVHNDHILCRDCYDRIARQDGPPAREESAQTGGAAQGVKLQPFRISHQGRGKPKRKLTESERNALATIAAIAISVVVMVWAWRSCTSWFSRTWEEAGQRVQQREDTFELRVVPATTAQLDKIALGLEREFTLSSLGFAVKSSSHRNGYYVAAEFVGPGVSDVAVWFLTGESYSEGGMVLSATYLAAEFSDWPKGWETKAEAGPGDEDCSLLRRYAERAVKQ